MKADPGDAACLLELTEGVSNTVGYPGPCPVQIVGEHMGVGSEHGAALLGPALHRVAVRLQDGEAAGADRDAPLGVGLGVLLGQLPFNADDSTLNRHLAPIPVDVRPAEPGHFPSAR